MPLSADTLDLQNELTTLRRALHRIPEIGLAEHETQRFVLDALKRFGVEASGIAGTGVKAVICGALPGPVTALRSDMDALNVQEPSGCGFESEHAGFMHACGHDGHMAMLLAAAKLLVEHKDRVRGTAVLLFQPCEELVKGAQMMVAEGALDSPKVDRAFALHVMPHIDEGNIGIVSGPAMASACEFEIEIKGKSAHGAMPHLGVDALTAAAHFITGAQVVISRCKPPEAPGLLTIGRLEAGQRHNIIAERAVMEGTLRCYDAALMGTLRERLLAHLKGLEEAWGVRTEFREMSFVPPVVNDAGLASMATGLMPEAAVPAESLMVAEDFCRYGERVPALMGFLGCRNTQKGFTAPLHASTFGFGEQALLWGLEFYKRLFIG